MKPIIVSTIVLLVGGMSVFIAQAGPFTAAKNIACPDAWAITDKAIPVVDASANPWGVPNGEVDDKALAKDHIESANPVETLDQETPITAEDLVNDPLTIASECLKYRNFEVDTVDYVAPQPSVTNTAVGWIPASIF